MQLRSIALILPFLCTPLFAQLPAARLSAVFPPGGRPGATIDVTVNGIDLDAASSLTFSHSGITAKPAGAGSRDVVKFTVAVAKDVPAGMYDCRVAGKYGISNPRVFVVDDREEATAKPGASASAAGKLPLDRVVSAQATASVVDYWTFEAAKGQRLMIDCEARVIDSRLSPSMSVVDAAGRELARSRRNGFIDFTAPETAAYTLRISDMIYRGGPEFFYRLSVGTGPHIDSIFPPVGVRGSKATYTLLGRNLPGGRKSALTANDGRPLDELSVEIELPKETPPAQRLDAAGLVGPSGVALNGIAYRLKTDKGASNPLAILYAETDAVLSEAESAGAAATRNDSPETAQALTLPATVAGRFYPRNDKDWYTVEARKGDVYYIEIIADRFGQATSAAVLVQRVGKGEKSDRKSGDVMESPEDETALGTPAFRTATRDPLLKWEVKEDGEYRLCVRDKFGVSADDPTRAYVLSIRKPAPDFQAVVTPLSAAASDTAVWNPIIRKGGSTPMRVAILRKDGHTGEVTIEAKGLPKGVTCSSLTLGGTDSAGLLAFTAEPDAPSWSGVVKIVARGKVADAEVAREASGGTVVWGTVGDAKNNDATKNLDPVVSRISRDIALGVCSEEADPLSIAATENKVYEVEAGTKLSIPLTVKRSTELKQALKLKPVGIEGLKGNKDITIEVKADTATFELDLNQARLAPGTYTFCLASAAQMKYTRPNEPAGVDDKGKAKKKDDAKDATITVYSAPITIKVLPSTKPEKKKG